MRQRTEVQALLSAITAVAIGAQPRAEPTNVAHKPDSDIGRSLHSHVGI